VKLLKHLSDQLIIQVDLSLDFLHVDRLKKVASLTISLIAALQVLHNVTFLVHIDIFEAFVVLSILVFVKEKVLFFYLNSFQSFQELASIIGLIFFAQSFQLDVNVD